MPNLKTLAILGGLYFIFSSKGALNALKQAVKIANSKGPLIPVKFSGANQLSANYTLEDFTRSQTAIDRNVNNAVYTVGNLASGILLAQNVLEPINERAGRVHEIASWYRSPDLNMIISGNDTGRHTTGGAADISGNKLDFLAAAVDTFTPEWDRLLIEGAKNDPFSVHIEYNSDLGANQRGIILHLPDGKTGNQISLEQAQNLYL